MFWLFSCIHIPISQQDQIYESDLFLKDIVLFEQLPRNYPTPQIISEDFPQTILQNFSDTFGEQPEVWTPRPPPIPTIFVQPTMIAQVLKKEIAINDSAITFEIVEEKDFTENTIPRKKTQAPLKQIHIPEQLFQQEHTSWLFQSTPRTLITWNLLWQGSHYEYKMVTDQFGYVEIDFFIDSQKKIADVLQIEIQTASAKQSVKRIVYPNPYRAQPKISDKILDVDIFDIITNQKTTSLPSIWISYEDRKRQAQKQCNHPCTIKKIQRHKPTYLSISHTDALQREQKELFSWPELQSISELENIKTTNDTSNVKQSNIQLYLPPTIHASDHFEGWLVLENLEHINTPIDIVVYDDKRQKTLIQGSFSVNASVMTIPITNIDPYTTELSLYYTKQGEFAHKSYELTIQQEVQNINQNIPWEVYLAEPDMRQSLRFLFSEEEWGSIFFSRYEYIDILFYLLQWLDAPSTIEVQWQRLLLGSLVWEGLYYGQIPIFDNFRSQVAEDHQILIENITQGLEDPYVFLALLVAQERGFYVPYPVLEKIKSSIEKHENSAIHLYLQFLLCNSSQYIQNPTASAEILFQKATPSEKIWLVPIIYKTNTEDLAEELNTNILPFLSTEEKGQLVMTLRKVKEMYNSSFFIRQGLQYDSFWELVGTTFFLQRRKKYPDTEIEIDIRENYSHILDGIVRSDNYNYITYIKSQKNKPTDIRITLTGQGMLRGGTLSFVEIPRSGSGIPIELQIQSNSQKTSFHNDVLEIPLHDLISFSYVTSIPYLYIPPTSLLVPIQDATQERINKQYKTSQLFQAAFCGDAYVPSATTFDNGKIGYSKSFHIRVICETE